MIAQIADKNADEGTSAAIQSLRDCGSAPAIFEPPLHTRCNMLSND
jgi:hypothetical protein